jgi:hypothetical protein
MTTETARAWLLDNLAVIHAAALNSSSLRTDHMTGLRLLLMRAQGFVCAGCGNKLSGTVEVCHINPSSQRVTGYEIVPGNVYAGCKACNTYDRNKTGEQIVRSMARPDVVARTHPTRKECVAVAETVSVRAVASIRDAVAESAI